MHQLRRLDPLVQGPRHTLIFAGNGLDGGPQRGVLPALLLHHPHCALAYLGREVVLLLHSSILSECLASAKPGAIQARWSLEEQVLRGLASRAWLRFGKVILTNSTLVLGEPMISGFGISQQALDYVRPDIESGLLRVVESDPTPPSLVYGAVQRRDNPSPALIHIVELAIETCDLSTRPIDRP